WVLTRYGIARIWGSWINRLAVFGTVLPVLVLCALALFRVALLDGRELPPVSPEEAGDVPWMAASPAVWLRTLTGIQFWFVVTVVTLRSGAGVIAEDFTNRAYQFYFSKPVTPLQYIVGRAAALAIFLFALVSIPTALLGMVLAALG